MQDVRQEKVRERAYQIWEREGRQDGRAEEHWSQAEQELAGSTEIAASDIVVPALAAARSTTNGSVKTAKPGAPRRRRGAQAKA
ncbi:MAG TPA: DUF2934 domain-containing protein [Beijerinckiaceae bacterium]|jgi:hypothetical protein